MYNKLFFLISLCVVYAHTMQKEKGSFNRMKLSIDAYKPSSYGSSEKLRYENGNFYVENKEGTHEIERAWLPKELHIANDQQVGNFIKAGGYFQLKKSADGKYSLDVCMRGPGGGKILGELFYWSTKGFLYGASAIVIGLSIANREVGTAEGVSVPPASLETTAAIVTAGTAAGAAASAVGMTPVVPYVESAAQTARTIGYLIPFL
jgi:hypothetical protein